MRRWIRCTAEWTGCSRARRSDQGLAPPPVPYCDCCVVAGWAVCEGAGAGDAEPVVVVDGWACVGCCWAGGAACCCELAVVVAVVVLAAAPLPPVPGLGATGAASPTTPGAVAVGASWPAPTPAGCGPVAVPVASAMSPSPPTRWP